MSAYDTATAKPEQDSAYAAAPIPWAWRVVKVLAVAATAVLLEVSLYYKSLEPGESSIAGWMAAILVLPSGPASSCGRREKRSA